MFIPHNIFSSDYANISVNNQKALYQKFEELNKKINDPAKCAEYIVFYYYKKAAKKSAVSCVNINTDNNFDFISFNDLLQPFDIVLDGTFIDVKFVGNFTTGFNLSDKECKFVKNLGNNQTYRVICVYQNNKTKKISFRIYDKEYILEKIKK